MHDLKGMWFILSLSVCFFHSHAETHILILLHSNIYTQAHTHSLSLSHRQHTTTHSPLSPHHTTHTQTHTVCATKYTVYTLTHTHHLLTCMHAHMAQPPTYAHTHRHVQALVHTHTHTHTHT